MFAAIKQHDFQQGANGFIISINIFEHMFTKMPYTIRQFVVTLTRLYVWQNDDCAGGFIISVNIYEHMFTKMPYTKFGNL